MPHTSSRPSIPRACLFSRRRICMPTRKTSIRRTPLLIAHEVGTARPMMQGTASSQLRASPTFEMSLSEMAPSRLVKLRTMFGRFLTNGFDVGHYGVQPRWYIRDTSLRIGKCTSQLRRGHPFNNGFLSQLEFPNHTPHFRGINHPPLYVIV